tara:strand:+ start:1314 stop:2159 length:846 start_codon:yes stop_codon:yes gene_type:complete
MKLNIQEFETKAEKIAYMVENKSSLIKQAKTAMKKADDYGVTYIVSSVKSLDANKAETGEQEEGVLNVKAVINTTGLMDSHEDVHIKGLWKKTLSEFKRPLHLQEHKSNSFEHIISSGEDLRVSAKTLQWKTLGFDKAGSTQALVFESKVRKDRNPFMYNQYKNGWVDNHSVGMRYVKIDFAVNDKDYEAEKAVWDKYIDQVANKEQAESVGYFWAVTEAKMIEGSAVPNGSNSITPTMSVKTFEEKTEPSILDMIGKMDTQQKAAPSTFDICSAIKKHNF